MNLPRRSFLSRALALVGLGTVAPPVKAWTAPKPGTAYLIGVDMAKPHTHCERWRIDSWTHSPYCGSGSGTVKVVVTDGSSWMGRTVSWWAPTQTFLDGQLDARATCLAWVDDLNGIRGRSSKTIKLDF